MRTRIFFGTVVIVATAVRGNAWELEAFSVDNVEHLGPAFDVEPITVSTFDLFAAAAAMAQAAAEQQQKH